MRLRSSSQVPRKGDRSAAAGLSGPATAGTADITNKAVAE
jgi:hypothetical protein